MRAQRCKSVQELNVGAANSPFAPDGKHLSSSEADSILAHHVKANLAGWTNCFLKIKRAFSLITVASAQCN